MTLVFCFIDFEMIFLMRLRTTDIGSTRQTSTPMASTESCHELYSSTQTSESDEKNLVRKSLMLVMRPEEAASASLEKR